jgi:shikimate kinase
VKTSGRRFNWPLNGAMPEVNGQSFSEQTGEEEEKPSAKASPSGILRIVLTGFMGAGKSTIGPLLAARLGWQFVDVDTVIETAHGASIAALFQQHGEPWFRQVEHATILDFLGISHLVLALGGGAIEDQRTRDLLMASEGTQLVHLEVSLETVLLRCSGTEASRPVLRDRANLEGRYARRLPLYRQAHLNLPVDNTDPETVTKMLSSLLSLG